MARPKKKTTSVSHLLIPEEPKTGWQKFLAHLEENIKLYLAGILFILICVAIGALIRVNTVVKEKTVATKYADAALETDAKARLEKYRAIGEDAGRWTPEVLYMTAETALEVGDAEAARQAYEKIVSNHADSEFVSRAKDGLAYLARNEGKLEDALNGYEELTQKWPGDFVARRAHYTMGEILEELGRNEEAIAAYRKQATVFPESSVATKAEQALQRLQKKFPDLFPAEGEGEGPADAGLVSEGDAAQTDALTVDAPAVAAEGE